MPEGEVEQLEVQPEAPGDAVPPAPPPGDATPPTGEPPPAQPQPPPAAASAAAGMSGRDASVA